MWILFVKLMSPAEWWLEPAARQRAFSRQTSSRSTLNAVSLHSTSRRLESAPLATHSARTIDRG